MRRKNTTTEMMMDYISKSLIILMQKESFSTISIGEIAQKAGVNRSTYYRNFKSKEDIIRFYFKRILQEFTFDETVLPENRLQELLNHYLKYKKELLLIYKSGLSYLILDALNDFVKPMIEKDMPLEKLCKIYWYTGAVYNTLLLWFSQEMRESPEKLSKIYVAIDPTHLEQEVFIKPFLFNK